MPEQPKSSNNGPDSASVSSKNTNTCQIRAIERERGELSWEERLRPKEKEKGRSQPIVATMRTTRPTPRNPKRKVGKEGGESTQRKKSEEFVFAVLLPF